MCKAIDLTPFVSKGDYREYMTKPFEIDGNTYASDGYSAIMLNESQGFEAPKCTNDFLESLSNIFGIVENGDFVEMPPERDLKMVECLECRGTGLAHGQCEECDGSGELEFDTAYNNYVIECASCCGDGKSRRSHATGTCIECDGNKVIPCKIDCIEKLGDCKVNMIKFNKFRGLPNVKYSYLGDLKFGFIFDGGKGVLMGLSN